jgi:hypothetical protein
MTTGFIVLWRKMLESWIWRLSAIDFKLAVLCLLMANWKDGEFFDGKQQLQVCRGEFVTSAKKLANKLEGGHSEKAIRGGLRRLSAAGFLKVGTERGRRYTHVTILNYSQYQDVKDAKGTDTCTERALSGHRVGPARALSGTLIEQENKKSKKQGNKGGGQKTKIPPAWAPNNKHAEKAARSGVDVGIEHDKFKNWAEANGRKFVSWDAAFHNWLTKAAEFAARDQARQPAQPQERML